MNIITSSMASKAKKSKLRKKEVMYIEKRLNELDLEVMEVFVIKEVETVEQHISFYSTSLVLWHYMKTSLRLEKLLEFLQRTFCQLFLRPLQG